MKFDSLMLTVILCIVLCISPIAFAADEAAKQPEDEKVEKETLAKKLNNPVAHLISVPFQGNYDSGIGPEDGHKFYVNMEPVIPISITKDFDIISRTVLSVVSQDNVFGKSGSQSGLSDLEESLFLSPKKPTNWGLIWGAGPIFLLPSATDDLLGSGKFGIGPTIVLLKQHGPWTYGLLANHIWSVAGESDREKVDNTYLQPFVCYTTKDAWTFSLNSESNYDWTNSEWSIPVNAVVSKLVKIDKLPVSFFGGVRYWIETPKSGPEGIAFRFGVTLLFPEK